MIVFQFVLITVQSRNKVVESIHRILNKSFEILLEIASFPLPHNLKVLNEQFDETLSSLKENISDSLKP